MTAEIKAYSLKILTYIVILSGCILIILSLINETDGKMLIGVFLILTPTIINLAVNTFTIGKNQHPDRTGTLTEADLIEE